MNNRSTKIKIFPDNYDLQTNSGVFYDMFNYKYTKISLNDSEQMIARAKKLRRLSREKYVNQNSKKWSFTRLRSNNYRNR